MKRPKPPGSTGSTASTSASSTRGSSAPSNASADCEEVTKVPWDDLVWGHRIHPHRKYAHCADDVHMLSKFSELIRMPDTDAAYVRLLLRTLKLLHLCDYSVEDICSIMAHATRYFEDTWGICGNDMDASEVGNVIVALMYIAHSYIQDETCPLHVWHHHLFERYCPMSTLNAALFRLLEIRHFILRLHPADLEARYNFLLPPGRLKLGESEDFEVRAGGGTKFRAARE